MWAVAGKLYIYSVQAHSPLINWSRTSLAMMGRGRYYRQMSCIAVWHSDTHASRCWSFDLPTNLSPAITRFLFITLRILPENSNCAACNCTLLMPLNIHSDLFCREVPYWPHKYRCSFVSVYISGLYISWFGLRLSGVAFTYIFYYNSL